MTTAIHPTPLLGDSPILEDHDAVNPPHRPQPVGDDYPGAAGEESVDGALDVALGGGVETR